MGTFRPLPHPNQHCKMRGWNRPTARIYASNGAPVGYTSSSRSARATSVAAGSQSSSANSFVRSASVAPSSQLEGYSGIYGRQLAQLNQRTSSASSAAARVSTAVSSTKTVQEKTTTTVEKSSKSKVDLLKEQKTSLEYGKSSKCAALRRAEIHAQNSGKDPRHVPVPRNVDDDICYLVADIHLPLLREGGEQRQLHVPAGQAEDREDGEGVECPDLLSHVLQVPVLQVSFPDGC